MMRPYELWRLSPLAGGGPSTLIQLAIAAAPWALVAVLALAMLAR
ncbi:MAG: hypothetical protein ACK4RV_14750 [Caulobacter sp.]|jgi:hypothetical protein